MSSEYITKREKKEERKKEKRKINEEGKGNSKYNDDEKHPTNYPVCNLIFNSTRSHCCVTYILRETKEIG